MGKYKQVCMDWEEQAQELGYQSVEEAKADGYKTDTEESEGILYGVLHKPEEPEQDEADRLAEMQLLSEQAHAEAHLAWLAERELVLGELDKVLAHKTLSKHNRARIEHAINFIRMGEM